MKSFSERAFMLAFLAEPDTFRPLLLTDHQIGLVKNAQGRSALTARQLADEEGISLSNASQQLVKLWRAGWLSRKQRSDPTGGLYYSYDSAI